MNNIKLTNIVCLGGGSGGTSTLLRGLRDFGAHLTSITSMADDGGSSGRLRKAYGIMQPGNLIMLAEMLKTKDIYKALEVTKQLLGVTNANILPATDQRTRLSAITA